MRADTLLSVASLLQPLTPPLHGRAAVMLASSEFSRPVSVDRKQKYQKAELVASPEECAALCKRFDLEGLDSLVADVRITRVKMGEDTLRVRASGSLTGIGVSRKNFGGERVTLDVQAIEFEAYYATESEDDLGGEIDLSSDEAFDEPIIDGEINLVRPRASQPPARQPATHAPSPSPRRRPLRAARECPPWRVPARRCAPAPRQGELVAQQLYLHLSELTLQELTLT
jgi:hypothetical protein